MKTGIEDLDKILANMHEAHKFHVSRGEISSYDIYISRIEIAVNKFLADNKQFFCTNVDCPIKKTLKEMV